MIALFLTKKSFYNVLSKFLVEFGFPVRYNYLHEQRTTRRP